MKINTIYKVGVQSSLYWNDTALRVVAGADYICEASGYWIDGSFRCTSAGYRNKLFWPFEWLRRAPHENWFAMIAAIDHDRSSYWAIKSGEVFSPRSDGLLSFFANDVSVMYWNNKGEIQISVTRVK